MNDLSDIHNICEYAKLLTNPSTMQPTHTSSFADSLISIQNGNTMIPVMLCKGK